jgi:hypothetical protein
LAAVTLRGALLLEALREGRSLCDVADSSASLLEEQVSLAFGERDFLL